MWIISMSNRLNVIKRTKTKSQPNAFAVILLPSVEDFSRYLEILNVSWHYIRSLPGDCLYVSKEYIFRSTSLLV